MTSSSAISILGLSHHYGDRKAVSDLSLSIAPGEVFALLGPNGSGKTTLFRVLSTLIPIQQGEVQLCGADLRTQTRDVQAQLGVVFQAASLDRKLSVRENLKCQGPLYGVTGQALHRRIETLLEQFGLADRAKERVETLSGGLRRRVELVKGLLHEPRLLLLDEPSTGLDPGARSDLWRYLLRLRDETRVTIVLTTHILEEAERADRLAILDQGKLVALDSPVALQATIGGDAVTVRVKDPGPFAEKVRAELGWQAELIDGVVRLEQQDGGAAVAELVNRFGDEIQTVTWGQPTLEDVFIAKTGHRFRGEEQEKPA